MILTASGGASIALGAVGLVLRATEAERFNARGCLLFPDRDEVVGGFSGCIAAYRSGSAWEVVGIAGLTAGGAAALTGLILWATAGGADGAAERRAGLHCAPDLLRAGLQCAARF